MCFLFVVVEGHAKDLSSQEQTRENQMMHVFNRNETFKNWEASSTICLSLSLFKAILVDVNAPPRPPRRDAPLGARRQRPQGMWRHLWRGCKHRLISASLMSTSMHLERPKERWKVCNIIGESTHKDWACKGNNCGQRKMESVCWQGRTTCDLYGDT
jgi:hypothetical protein